MAINPIGKGLTNVKLKKLAEISAKSIFMFLMFCSQHTAEQYCTGWDLMKKNETSSARPAVTSCQFAKLIWESLENLYIFSCSFLPFDERKPQVISKLMSENP